ncbi:MAG: 1,4-alpha-glucan branching protein GlgB [Myxococcaceae bacterium]
MADQQPAGLEVEALRALVSLRSPSPHHVLGAHRLAGGGVVFRVHRPDARSVSVHVSVGGGASEEVALQRRGDFPAIFEGTWAGAQVAPYELELTFDHGVSREKDPYAFLPTLGPADLHYVGEGRHRRMWDRLGAHPLSHQGVRGVSFVVWAPNAEGVALVGDFNAWDDRRHPMRSLGASGLWELFVPGATAGQRYKFEIFPRGGAPFLKADPLAFRAEVPPLSASVVHALDQYTWNDARWLEERKRTDRRHSPMSVYEVHLGSWMRKSDEGNRSLTYRELAPKLAAHVGALGFTHVEFLPVAEHPFGGSWGYQVSGYYAPSARFGSPDDFRFLVDTLHQHGIGVIVDWVPGHFPRDTFALGTFDGTALYEHADPRKGAHPDWGTLIFNFGRNEVRNFLVANALFWLEQYHVDGLRVDAVASMLYLDYSRKEGEWVPNQHGGRENEEAIAFLRELNETVRHVVPDAVVMAEESTSWPRVSHPVRDGGLGFTHKWNMGWMHDTLKYFEKDPIYRKHHHHQMTFGLMYAYSEQFVLPLSHDEVVHGKKSLLGKMPGDEWQKRANLRALYAWMWAHPGKKLLFMGGELGQPTEWNHDASVEWHLAANPQHGGIAKLLAKLNALYRQEGSLFETDFHPQGFQWVQADAVEENVYVFIRRGRNAWREIVCVANLNPSVREYRVGLPGGGWWAEILNTDSGEFGGSNVVNAPRKAEHYRHDGQPASTVIRLPPLGVCWFAPVDEPKK